MALIPLSHLLCFHLRFPHCRLQCFKQLLKLCCLQCHDLLHRVRFPHCRLVCHDLQLARCRLVPQLPRLASASPGPAVATLLSDPARPGSPHLCKPLSRPLAGRNLHRRRPIERGPCHHGRVVCLQARFVFFTGLRVGHLNCLGSCAVDL